MRTDEYDLWWQENTDDEGEPLADLPEPIATLAAHVMSLQARIDKLPDPTAVEADPRGWDTQCACAYDHPDAVCAVHQLAAEQHARLAAQARDESDGFCDGTNCNHGLAAEPQEQP